MGVSFLGLLTIVFVCAKLFGVISWSWFLVFLPVLIPFIFWASVILGGLFVWFTSFIFDKSKK